MKIPSSLIKNFITSEFPEAILTSTGEYHFNSPFSKDTKKKLYMSSEDGRFIDFKGGIEPGSFLTFVKEYIGLNNYSEALNYLVTNYNFNYEVEKQKEIDTSTAENKKIIYDFISKEKPKLFGDCSNLGLFGKMALKYLQDRKIEKEYIPKLGYIYNTNSKYNGRIFIPFFENHKIVYFIARTVNPKEFIRYMNADKLNSKEFVFNIDKINEDVVICEGTFDAMSITSDQAATALLSADIGTKQLEKLYDKKVKRIIYVADKDETGRKKMNNNISKIIKYCPYTGLKVYTYDIPFNDCKDLNDLKIKHGKNYILRKECEEYGSKLFKKSLW